MPVHENTENLKSKSVTKFMFGSILKKNHYNF